MHYWLGARACFQNSVHLVQLLHPLTILLHAPHSGATRKVYRVVLREVMRLPERERKIMLGIVRQLGEMSG